MQACWWCSYWLPERCLAIIKIIVQSWSADLQMLTQELCMQINAEKSPYLVEKLKIWMLPTLALIRQEKTVDYVVGFDDLGGKDDFTTEVIYRASPIVFTDVSLMATALGDSLQEPL